MLSCLLSAMATLAHTLEPLVSRLSAGCNLPAKPVQGRQMCPAAHCRAQVLRTHMELRREPVLLILGGSGCLVSWHPVPDLAAAETLGCSH